MVFNIHFSIFRFGGLVVRRVVGRVDFNTKILEVGWLEGWFYLFNFKYLEFWMYGGRRGGFNYSLLNV